MSNVMLIIFCLSVGGIVGSRLCIEYIQSLYASVYLTSVHLPALHRPFGSSSSSLLLLVVWLFIKISHQNQYIIQAMHSRQTEMKQRQQYQVLLIMNSKHCVESAFMAQQFIRGNTRSSQSSVVVGNQRAEERSHSFNCFLYY